MGEFVKKTMMGYREVPGGHSDPECTHVILTETEYAKLQRKISDAEQLARTTKYEAEREVDSARRDADYKIRQNVEKANQTIKRWSEALDAERAESGHLRSLNENLLRIARERANADRKLKPKKEHTGYSVVFSTEKEHRYGKGKNMTRVMLWETVIQSPYSIDLPEGLVRKQITDELTRVNEDGESLICRIGIDSFYPGSYAAMMKNRNKRPWYEIPEETDEPEEHKEENIMLLPHFRANFKTVCPQAIRRVAPTAVQDRPGGRQAQRPDYFFFRFGLAGNHPFATRPRCSNSSPIDQSDDAPQTASRVDQRICRTATDAAIAATPISRKNHQQRTPK
mgnify:CR=1 FL=1